MIQEVASKTFFFDLNIFNELKSSTNDKQLLKKLQQQESNDYIIQKKLIEIIKYSAHQDGIENIAGKAFSVLKKLTKTIRWENFSKIHLKDCSMKGMNFIDCNFSDSILEYVSIESCWFIRCCLDRMKWSNIICSEYKMTKVEGAKIHSLESSPDGTLLIVKIEKGTQSSINILDFYSGDNLRSISLPKYIIKNSIFLMKEIIVFPIYYDRQLKIQNIRNGKFKIIQFSKTIYSQFYIKNGLKNSFLPMQQVQNLRAIDIKGKSLEVVSSCGKYAAYRSNDLIEIYDLLRATTIIVKYDVFLGLTSQLFFSQNNQEIGVMTLKNVYFWNLNSLKLSRQIEFLNLRNFEPQLYRSSILTNDGKMLITFQEKVITLFSIQTGEKIKIITVNHEIQFVVSHSIKQILMVVCKESYIYYIDYMVGKKEVIKNFQNPSLSQFALSYDSEFVANVSTGQLKVINMSTGKEIKCLEINNIMSTAFSPINNVLLLGKKDSSISFYEIQTQRCKEVFYDQQYGCITTIVFSPDGIQMAFTGTQINHIVICEGMTGNQLYLLKGHSEQIKEIQFSLQGELLASISEKTIRLWNPKSQNQCQKTQLKSSGSKTFAISPNSTQLAYVNEGRKTIIVYYISQKKYKFFQYPNQINQLKFFQVWLILLCCIQEKLEIIDVDTGGILKSFKFQASAIFFSFDEKILVSCSKDSTQLWNVNQQKSVQVQNKFQSFQIKLLNLYSQKGKYIKGIDSTCDGAEIISKHGFNLIEVLKNPV